MQILVFNAGSSSLKFEVLAAGEWNRILRGSVEGYGASATVTMSQEGRSTDEKTVGIPDVAAAVEYVFREALKGIKIDAVGHRVVHGGERFHDAAKIDDGVIAEIKKCAELAPLHNAASLQGIVATQATLGPGIPQVAVFDTAFHQTLPARAFLYAVPHELYTTHAIRRYGFHGSSYRSILERYLRMTGKPREASKIIVLHLGNGCSICAIEGGKSIDTSMGLTPLEGLVMGTRSGDVDASIVDFLVRTKGQTTDEIESMLNKESGLLGVSGRTNDMRGLLKAIEEKRDQNGRAELAIELFCYRARKYIGSYLAALSGADAIIFTGGIGEHNGEIRRRICQGLAWFGIQLDEQRNGAGSDDRLLSAEDSRIAVYVIATDEELVIAQDTARLAGQSGSE